MTPVISPLVFYLMPVCENVKSIATVTSISIAVVIIMLAVGCFVYIGIDDDEVKKFVGIIKKLIPFLVIALVFTCFIPTEETVTKMIIAQNVTVERVDMVSDTVVTVYNDIMALFQESGATNG